MASFVEHWNIKSNIYFIYRDFSSIFCKKYTEVMFCGGDNQRLAVAWIVIWWIDLYWEARRYTFTHIYIGFTLRAGCLEAGSAHSSHSGSVECRGGPMSSQHPVIPTLPSGQHLLQITLNPILVQVSNLIVLKLVLREWSQSINRSSSKLFLQKARIKKQEKVF